MSSKAAARVVAVGDPDDLALIYLGWKAEELGLQFLMLDEANLGDEWSFRIDGEVTIDTGSETILATAGRCGIVVRFRPDPQVPVDLDSALLAVDFIAERRSAIEWMLNCASAVVVNRPRAGRSNGSKPLQMRELHRLGMMVPEWVTTNSIDVALRFAEVMPNGCVVKSVSGIRSHVRDLDDQMFQRLSEATSPVVIQRKIPGIDIRVHVVGDSVYGCSISGAGLDYRFESRDADYSPVALGCGATLCACRPAAIAGTSRNRFQARHRRVLVVSRGQSGAEFPAL